MKTKMIKLLLVVGVLASCTSDLTDNDAALVLASAALQLTQQKVTADNSLYEGDLYRYYLNTEIEKTDLEIKALQELVDSGKGGDDAKKKLELTLSKKASLNVDLGNILDVYIGIKPPRPPCPRPRNCDFGFDFVVAPAGAKNLEVFVRDSNGYSKGGTIGSIKEMALPKGTLSVVPFNFKNFKGKGTVEVKFTNSAGSERQYVIPFN